MSDPNPYEQLQVSEDASFDDIQTARDRMIEAYRDDDRSRGQVEIAYDAILMDRLRKRQEGKIKVPEGIRFAERLADKPPKFSMPRMNPSPSWLQRTLDAPNAKEISMLGGVYAVLGVIGILAQQNAPVGDSSILQFLLAIGFGITFYWLNRKEQKLGRAVLLSLGALVVGGLLGAAFLQGFHQSGLLTDLSQDNTVIASAVLFIFWLVSSFLR
ncbi:MAG: CPP1-like family protein [Thermosynechococcaceae cyanobacterium]